MLCSLLLDLLADNALPLPLPGEASVAVVSDSKMRVASLRAVNCGGGGTSGVLNDISQFSRGGMPDMVGDFLEASNSKVFFISLWSLGGRLKI